MKQYCHSKPRCKHFVSWREFMSDDDPFEPDDCGKCEKKENYQTYYKEPEEMTVDDETEICKYYEAREAK